jgi:hypothetical protein
MYKRLLLAIGIPLLIIFGYPALIKTDSPKYYRYLSFMGITLICIYFFIKNRRNKKKGKVNV